MTLLLLFAFLGGFVTILSPCILPVLPIVLSGSLTGGKQRPLGIIAGFIGSFTFFTLLLSAIVKATGIPSDALRNLSVVIIFLFGVALLFPQTQVFLETLIAKLSPQKSPTNREGFGGGVLIGLSLGLIWAPCVGPILASVITLAATSQLNSTAFLITLAYSLGTAIPLFAITYGGRNLLNKVPWLLQNTTKIQKFFGALMILTALALYQGYDRTFQAYILEKFPNYGAGLTSIEDNQQVKQELEKLKSSPKSLNLNQKTAPELIGGGTWINSEPLTLSELKGKVVLVDFWTYSCINCIRTLPFLRAWHEKYRQEGLVIIGVHSPEFEFEKISQNVKTAANDFDLTYPIVQDNDFLIWKAYDNHYWPAKYLIDKDGMIRYTHFGEGKYNETEKMIQELLKETGSSPDESLIEIETPKKQAYTPEIYLGYWRIENENVSPKVKKDVKTIYKTNPLQPNEIGFEGEWTIAEKYSKSQQNSRLSVRYKSKDVYLVMRSEKPTKATISIDGILLKNEMAGSDVEDGVVVIEKDRLYHLINNQSAQEHTITIEFLDGSTEVYAFTFG